MENEEIPSQTTHDTSLQGEASAPVATDVPAEVVPPDSTVNPVNTAPDITAQIPVVEPLPSSGTVPVERAGEQVLSAPVSIVPTSSPATHTSIVRELLTKARAKMQFRKRVKLEKVMALFTKHAHITNDDVEKLLHISDATATRYLATLEKENKIRRIGKTGKYTNYEKI